MLSIVELGQVNLLQSLMTAALIVGPLVLLARLARPYRERQVDRFITRFHDESDHRRAARQTGDADLLRIVSEIRAVAEVAAAIAVHVQRLGLGQPADPPQAAHGEDCERPAEEP